MKKSIFLVVLLSFAAYRTQAQENYFIINPALDSSLVVNLKDTLLTAYGSSNTYTLDLDGNNITDLKFCASFFWNGWGGSRSIQLSICYDLTFPILGLIL
jgi:hypothetical protein